MESLTIDDQMLLWEVIAQKAIQKVEEDANQGDKRNGSQKIKKITIN